MILDRPSLVAGDHPRRTIDQVFELVRHGEVLDGAAHRADEVMVMLSGELIGDLEVAVLIGGDDSPDHPGVDELGEVAVGGALGEVVVVGQDLGQGDRSVSSLERFDNRPPRGGVALAMAAQDLGYGVVQVVHPTIVVAE